jgi:hypothetical protein
LPYNDEDFLTTYYILKTHFKPSKRLYNAFYFGCCSSQHHLGTYTYLHDLKDINGISYIAYGADLNKISTVGFDEINPIKPIQGFDRTGNLLSVSTLKSINNMLDEKLVGDIWLYICDINPKSKIHLYNQLILAMRVENGGLIVLRLPYTWDIHTYIFIIFCIEMFSNIEIFKAPWNNNFYLICRSHYNLSYYAEYIKYVQRSIHMSLLSAQFIESRENIIADIKTGLMKLNAENALPEEINEWFVEV